MKVIGRLGLMLGAVLFAASPARANWLSNLNPFGSKSSSSDASSDGSSKSNAPPGSAASLQSSLGSSKYNSKTPAGSGGSTVVPQLNNRPIHPVNSVTPVNQNSPSLLSRIGSAPANLFSKTKNLFSKSAPPPPQRTMLGKPSGGSQFTHSGSAAVRQQSTTSQFIARPRPGF